MSTTAKILVVLNLILAGAFLMAASNFLAKQDNWKTKHDDAVTEYTAKLQVEKDKTKKQADQNVNLQKQVFEAQKQQKASTEEARVVREQIDLLKASFDHASGQLTTATYALAKALETIKAQRQMVDGLQQEGTTLREAIRKALEQKDAAVRNLNEKEIQFEGLLATKQALEKQITDLKGELRSATLTAETAVARAGAGTTGVPMDQPAHTGQVLGADNDANIAVISLGAEDGVRPGFRYVVSRGRDYVATIVITDVQAKQSAGRAIKGLSKGPIMRGDHVMSR
ncbi:MAG: hypothetical protein ACC662_03800 [Planctomycetota bacterium]